MIWSLSTTSLFHFLAKSATWPQPLIACRSCVKAVSLGCAWSLDVLGGKVIVTCFSVTSASRGSLVSTWRLSSSAMME